MGWTGKRKSGRGGGLEARRAQPARGLEARARAARERGTPRLAATADRWLRESIALRAETAAAAQAITDACLDHEPAHEIRARTTRLAWLTARLAEWDLT